MKYLCPVCGYRELEDPPEDHTICPSCGTHFDYDDFGLTFQRRTERWAELRQHWFERGAPWFSDYTRRPNNWNPHVQLIESGLAVTTHGAASDIGTVTLMNDHDVIEADVAHSHA